MDCAAAPDEVHRDLDSLNVSSAEIKRLHLHLTHASSAVITRIFKTAGIDIALDQVKIEFSKCSCADTSQRAHRPIAQATSPPFPCHTLCVDVFAIVGNADATLRFLLI